MHKVAFRVHETIVWDTPPDLPDLADPADLLEVVSLSAAQTLPAHTPGVRMTVVINILPQNIRPPSRYIGSIDIVIPIAGWPLLIYRRSGKVVRAKIQHFSILNFWRNPQATGHAYSCS